MTPDSFVPVSCSETSTMSWRVAIWRKRACCDSLNRSYYQWKMRRRNCTSIDIIRVWNYFVCQWFLPRLTVTRASFQASCVLNQPAVPSDAGCCSTWWSLRSQEPHPAAPQRGGLRISLPVKSFRRLRHDWFAVYDTIKLHIPLFNRPRHHQKQDISWYKAYLGSQKHQ